MLRGLNLADIEKINLKLYTSNQDLWFKLTFQHMLCRRLMQRLSGMQSRTVFTAVSEKSPLRQLLIHPCFFWFHNKYTPSSFPIFFCLCLCRYLEKRSSGGGSFSSFRVPSQKDQGLCLRQKSDEQDEESKENMESRGCESDKRLSTNGDMEIH